MFESGTDGSPCQAVAEEGQLSQSFDWYHEGQSRTVEVAGVLVTVRYVGRSGRRSRICVTAPAGAVFSSVEQQKREL